MKITFLSVFLLLQLFVFAQKKPTQAEINKLKQMQAQMEKDPRVKKALAEMDDENSDVKWGKLPSFNKERFASLPKEPLNVETLASFIGTIKQKLQSGLPSSVVQTVKLVMTEANNDAEAISRSAIGSWYNHYPQEALLLGVNAAVLNSTNNEILNTLSALLNLCGFEHKAIPILQLLNTKSHDNSTILNNLGQAYLALGDQQKAEEYLLLAVSKCPTHVEANKSLGMIYQAKGLMTKAKNCFQKSLKGAYTPTAEAGAKKINMSDAEIFSAFQNHPIKEYFNSSMYQLPPICEDISRYAELTAKHEAFRTFLQTQTEKYDALMSIESEKIMNTIQQLQPKSILLNSPLLKKAERMYGYWLVEYGKFWVNEYGPAYGKYYEKIISLKQEYAQKSHEINGSTFDPDIRCQKHEELAKSYLPLFAFNQKNFIEKILIAKRGYVDEFSYWSQFLNHIGQARLYVFSQVKDYLEFLDDLSNDNWCSGPCKDNESKPETNYTDEPIDVDCPFKMNLKFGIGKLSLSCETFEIELSAALIFNYEKNLKTHESSLAFGIGTPSLGNIPFTGKVPELDLGFISGSAEAKEQIYITFDADGKVSDLGLKYEAGVDGSLGGENSGIEFEAKSGYTLGINSGWNFETHALGFSQNLL